jgi:signal transduction histidine kinase/ActR/RegA family two-component response regulator
MENKPKLLGSIFVPILASAGAMFLLVAFLIYKWMLHIEIEDGKRFAHTSLNSLALKCEASSSLSDLQRMMLSMKTSGPILDIYFSDDSSVILSCKLSERNTSLKETSLAILGDQLKWKETVFFHDKREAFVAMERVYVKSARNPFAQQWAIIFVDAKPWLNKVWKQNILALLAFFIINLVMTLLIWYHLKQKVLKPIFQLKNYLHQKASGDVRTISLNQHIHEWSIIEHHLNENFDKIQNHQKEMRVKNQLLESNIEILNATMNSTTMGYFIFNWKNQKILLVNDQFLNLWAILEFAEQIKNGSFSVLDVITLITPYLKDQQVFFEEFEEMVASSKKGRKDHEFTTTDGRVFRFMVYPVLKDQHYFGHLLLVEDVSERKKALLEIERSKEDALQASRVKSEFLANMSHEIRTPMNGIMGSAKLLTEQILDEESKELSLMIYESTESLLAIINDILDYSKIEAGKFDIEIIPSDVSTLCQGVFQTFEKFANDKGVDLVLNQKKLPSLLMVDPTRVRQILLNLVSNAVKFTEKGVVSIDVYWKSKDDGLNGELIAEVKDTGIGMTEEQVNKIFESFSQADASTSRKFGGTGLGTTISKRLAELMDGDILVSSKVGKGSRLTLVIPSKMVDKKTLKIKDSSVKHNLDRDYQSCILLAEDNHINQKVAKKQLLKLGLEVDIATNGFEAVQMALENPDRYSMILMDIQMPEMNGLEATEELLGANYKNPIIAMTANVMEDDIKEYLEAGLLDFIPKPFQLKDLVNVFDRFLENRKES